MIYSDIIRGILILLLPFTSSIWLIYSVLFLSNIASSFLDRVVPIIFQNMFQTKINNPLMQY